MKIKLALIFLFTIIMVDVSAQTDFELGLKYYKKRSEGAKNLIAPQENINTAISYFEKCFNTSDEEKAAELYMQSIYFKANYCYPEGSKERKPILAAGKKKGKELLARNQKSASTHYWYAVLLGTWAKESGVIAAAKEGVIDKLKEECEIVIDLDQSYDYGAGFRFLGILHLDAPYIPFFLTWPDDDIGVELLRKSLKFNPHHISGQYYYAKALNEVGKKEKAIEVLKKVTEQKPSEERYLEEISELDLCKSLLDDLTK